MPLGGTGHRCGQQGGAVETEEPNAPSTGRVDDEGADVHFREAGEPSEGREPGKPNRAHAERDQPHPGRPVDRVDAEPCRKQPLDLGGRVPPAERGEVVPALQYQRMGHWPGRTGGDRSGRPVVVTLGEAVLCGCHLAPILRPAHAAAT